MSIMDEKLVFSDSQSCACASGASIYSSNIVDLGAGANFYGAAKNQNPGVGVPLWLNAICEDEDFTKTGAGTDFTLALVSGTANDGTNITAGEAVVMSRSLTATDCDDGDLLISQPLPATPMGRYLQLKITCPANMAISAGKMTGWLGGQMATPESMK